MIIEIIKGDITNIEVDAIVNAANSSLLGGGGVDGAIHRKAGPGLLMECRKIRDLQGGCKTGEAVFTSAGKLAAKYVIHTVGPVWNSGKANEEKMLENCYNNALIIAEKLNASSIAFPNISTGIYGFPKELAVDIVYQVIEKWNKENMFKSINKLYFVNFDEDNYQLYMKKFGK